MPKYGMCAAYTLNNPRVIRLEPPLIISEDEVRMAVGSWTRQSPTSANCWPGRCRTVSRPVRPIPTSPEDQQAIPGWP